MTPSGHGRGHVPSLLAIVPVTVGRCQSLPLLTLLQDGNGWGEWPWLAIATSLIAIFNSLITFLTPFLWHLIELITYKSK